MSNNSENGIEQLGRMLSKLGVTTTADVQDMIRKDLDARFANMAKDKGEDTQEFLKHLRGECGNKDCPIGSEVQKLYSDGYKKGLMHGIPVGQFAMKKGLKF